MYQNMIFLPCFVLIFHTEVILVILFIKRVRAVSKKEISPKYFKTYDTEEKIPKHIIAASRNFSNLFELPTLFYALCLFSLVMKQVDQTQMILAWSFVALRIIHSFIHLTTNNIYPRLISYSIGPIIIIVMGTRLALTLI